jgi:hypothetical protein
MEGHEMGSTRIGRYIEICFHTDLRDVEEIVLEKSIS